MTKIIAGSSFKKEDRVVILPEILDLSGSTVSYPIFPVSPFGPMWGNTDTSAKFIIKSVLLTFIEAPPATPDATYDNIIRIGTQGSPALYTTISIPDNMSAGDTYEFAQENFNGAGPLVYSIESLWVRNGGGASGTGTVRVSIILSTDYTEYFNFNPGVTP